MHIKVTKNMFHNQFHVMNRVEQFSYDARSLLFDYLTEAEDNGENGEAGLELDIIGICCDFVEMSIDEFLRSYDIDISDEEDTRESIENYINDNSIFIGWSSNDSFVYVQF